MTMLDKAQPFSTHLGALIDNVKWVQGGNAYSSNGRFLGKMVAGKLQTPSQAVALKDAPNEAPLEDELFASMGRPELLKYAMDNYNVKLKGNLSAAALREQLKEL